MKLWAVVVLACTISSFSFADTSTNSFKTPGGQTVTIGDQVQDMQKKIDLSPISMSSTPISSTPNSPLETVYVYEIANYRYTIRTVNNQIQSIMWFNLDADPALITQSTQSY
ncbi:hypothetical protein JW980_12200 [Acinetobacter johnsonii]|uniref:hypothetical protein n=1 Tax=Acinetobacter johnsonii TaxID=40214 RepID=UPI000CE757AE|nr:hypothetical protein [Acinetobacter johnsonii]PPE76430.1 hypothetical protein C3941_29240 [Kaistia algarum]QQT56831.1 hypothetical protein I6I50_10595 [Acinetobacter johnsonii]QSE45041.1 hypothetical protein JW980_12200 [Acinetobacter johnsonii]